MIVAIALLSAAIAIVINDNVHIAIVKKGAKK